MLEWFAQSPDPDAGLLAFRKISEGLGETHWYLRKLRDEGEGAEQLAQGRRIEPVRHRPDPARARLGRPAR